MSDDFIPLTECKVRGVYRLRSRNLGVGVFDGNNGFIGIRTKFTDRYLDTEYHWDQGPPFGTARPEKLLCTLPPGIDLREVNPSECSACGVATTFIEHVYYTLVAEYRPTGYWVHTTQTDCDDPRPCRRMYQPLFDFLNLVIGDTNE
jgi:hypothetical protein